MSAKVDGVENTVKHFIFVCTLFRDFVTVDLFAEVWIRDACLFLIWSLYL